jgi:hypothetical protein
MGLQVRVIDPQTASNTLEGPPPAKTIMRRTGVDREDNHAPGTRPSLASRRTSSAIAIPSVRDPSNDRQWHRRAISIKDLIKGLRLDNPIWVLTFGPVITDKNPSYTSRREG